MPPANGEEAPDSRTRADTPRDLAWRFDDALRARGGAVDLGVLGAILETLYFASLRTEEAEGVRCQLVYLDPEDPDPDPPERIVQDRWRVAALGSPIPLTVANLVKIAKATDARASSFAVYPEPAGEIVIWGLVDQGNRYYEFVNFESDSGQRPPGVFVASIEGLAHLRAAIGYTTIAELRIDRIVQETVDIFARGPVRDALRPGLDAYESRVRTVVGKEMFDRRGHWTSSVTRYWVETLCRLVIRARRYGHGGAFLITPDDSLSELDVKHKLEYDRLCAALDAQAQAAIRGADASDAIFEMVDLDEEELPVALYLNESVETAEGADSRSALDGAIWFVSLLTRVDGLVVLGPDLAVRGFGAIITSSSDPAAISLAHDDAARERSPIPSTRWGTRHRSMMLYCWNVPGSVGFVLSQDGDVRVMTRLADEVVVWENPLLQLELPEAEDE